MSVSRSTRFSSRLTARRASCARRERRVGDGFGQLRDFDFDGSSATPSFARRDASGALLDVAARAARARTTQRRRDERLSAGDVRRVRWPHAGAAATPGGPRSSSCCSARSGSLEVVPDLVPRALVLRLFLAPDDFRRVRVALRARRANSSRGNGYSCSTRTIATSSMLALAGVLDQVVVDLAASRPRRADLRRHRASRSSGDHRLEARRWRVRRASTPRACGAAAIFGVITISGLRELAQHLPAQHVEHLRRRRRHARPACCSRAHSCRKRSRRAERVLRALAFVAVRQEQREAAEPAPLRLARGDELVDHDLRAVGEVAELRFPDRPARRARRSRSRTRSRAPLPRTAASR